MRSLVAWMARELLLPPHYLETLLRSAPYRYKVYDIPKRNGGVRVIAQPTPEVKLLQRWAVENVVSGLPVHAAATAYRKGLSIRENARVHARGDYLLKMDFREFFPSIGENGVLETLEKAGVDIPSEDIEKLVRLFCWRRRKKEHLVLAIGAPSSPFLSNAIMHDFDRQIADFCQRGKVIYTRYADDMSFSTTRRDVLRFVEREVNEVAIAYPYAKLRVNRDKTVYSSRGHRRRVTGLILTNDGNVSLGRQRKREIRAVQS